MKYKEYGKENSKTVVLLHGGGLSWWNFRREAELLQGDHRVILPVLDGHAGSDRHFSSIADNAAEIISFVNSNLGGRVYLIGGLSLGAQVLLEMLSQRGDICEHAFVESASVIPSGGVARALVRPAVSCSYPLIGHKWFARLQFGALKMDGSFFEDYYRDTRAIAKTDMISFLRASTSYAPGKEIKNCMARVHIFYGEKETRGIIKSARIINDMIPHSSCRGLPGMYHGGFSLDRAEEYADAVRLAGQMQ